MTNRFLMMKLTPHHASLLLAVLAYSFPVQAAIYTSDENAEEIVLTNTANDEEIQQAHLVVLVEDEIQITDVDNVTTSYKISTGLPYSQAVVEAAKKTNIEPALLHAVMLAESNFNPRALSPKGARGLMQLMPETGRRFHVSNLYDPQQNIMAGAQYLKELHGLFKGDKRLMLAAYNAGPGAVFKYGSQIPPYQETKQYVPRVLAYYQKIAARMTY